MVALVHARGGAYPSPWSQTARPFQHFPIRTSRPLGFLPDGAFEWRRLPDGVEDRTISLILELMRKQLAHGAELTPLRFKESGAMSGSGGDSSQLQIDEPPDGDAVAALLRRLSQVGGVSIGDAVAVASQ